MRIKKKYVLLESNLIDKSTEFSPQEKRLLWVLNKEFGPHDYQTFDTWRSALWLIEIFDIPYDLAYEISNTYYYNGDKLFSEFKPLRKAQNTTEVFFKHLGDFINVFKSDLESKTNSDTDSVVGDLDVEFIEDEYGKYKTDIIKRPLHFWGYDYMFTLYIPLNSRQVGVWPDTKYLSGDESNPRLIMVNVRFSKIKTPNDEDEYTYEGNPDKFNVEVTLKIGSDRSGEPGYTLDNWMSFDVPTPKPLSKEKINDTLLGIYNDVIEKLKKTKFNLPSGVEPLDYRNI